MSSTYRLGYKWGDYPSTTGSLEFLTSLDQSKLYENRHFWPQADLLYQPIENFNYVAKLENLVDDMREILIDTGQCSTHAEKLARLHKVEVGKETITSASSLASEYHNNETIKLTQRIYARDFEVFGYRKSAPIPNR